MRLLLVTRGVPVTFQANFILRSYEDDDAACASIFKQAWHAGHPYAPRRIGLDEFRYERQTGA